MKIYLLQKTSKIIHFSKVYIIQSKLVFQDEENEPPKDAI